MKKAAAEHKRNRNTCWGSSDIGDGNLQPLKMVGRLNWTPRKIALISLRTAAVQNAG